MDLKVVLLGSAFVGKTSLLERYVYDRFSGNVPYQNVSTVTLMIIQVRFRYFISRRCAEVQKQVFAHMYFK
jgi:GTPase SAR1 family protein